MILDQKIEGTLDQGNNCLIVFDELKCDVQYYNYIKRVCTKMLKKL